MLYKDLYEDGIYAEPVKIGPLLIHLSILAIFILAVHLLGKVGFLQTLIFSTMGYIFLSLGYFLFKRTEGEIMDRAPFRQIWTISWNFLWLWIFFKYMPKYFPSFPELKMSLDWLWNGVCFFLALATAYITDFLHFYFNRGAHRKGKQSDDSKEEMQCPDCGSGSFETFNEFHQLEVCSNLFPGHVSLRPMQWRCKGCGKIF
ncbi:MAG: hypothetical protein V3574_04620 [Candidatus Moraniibacteriota bacterium]